MKRTIALFVLCLTLLGCSSANDPTNDVPVNEPLSSAAPTIASPTDSPTAVPTAVPAAEPTSEPTTELTAEPTTEPTPEPVALTVEERVLLDQDGIVITLKSLDTDGLFGADLKVLVENNGSRNIGVQARDSAVNGVMIDTLFSCEVAPGKKANDEVTLSSSDLEMASIETIKDIELVFHVFDSKTWDTIFDSEPITITTSADPAFVQIYDDSGFVILEQSGVKMVVKKMDSEESFWGADIYVYIENNGDEDVIVQTRDMSVNGFMIDAMFSPEVLSGKRAFDTITFLESDLKDNGITSIETLEFRVFVANADSWEQILESEPVTVSFAD